jgi:hypothetical protein
MSRGTIIDTTLNLVTEECISCGVLFAIPSGLRDRLIDTHRNFYCPNGHVMQFTGQTEAQKAREEAARLQARLERAEAREVHLRDQLDTTERQRRVAKGQLTKVKNRIAAGVCPCCRRTFTNLADHMAGQHPDYAPGGAR